MAISLGGIQQRKAKRESAKRIAAEAERQSRKEGKRKKWASILGTVGGAVLGAAAVGLTGLTGGLAAPLVMGAATSLSKKWADEGTKKAGMGGDASKIQGDMYGFGKEEAAQYRSAIDRSRQTEFSGQTMLGDIASSYITAGMSGELTGGAKTLMAGGKGSLAKSLRVPGAKTGWEGVKQSIGSKLPSLGGGDSLDIAADTVVDPSTVGLPFVESPMDYSSAYEDYLSTGVSEEIPLLGPGYAQGGQVPNNQNLMALAILNEMANQKTTYDDTALQEIDRPTVAQVFEMKGKTLGGSNTQSLSQMLGR